ncbi:MAG: hypothetical protein QXN90_06525 [Zestosphaera sp.]
MLETLAIILAATHFMIPLTYYLHAKTRWLPKPWDLKVDENHEPKVTVIIPTCNESKLIKGEAKQRLRSGLPEGAGIDSSRLSQHVLNHETSRGMDQKTCRGSTRT